MPPRARKTAAAEPDPAVETETVPGAVDTPPDSVPEPAAGVAEPTHHWESVNGDGSEPCRHCPPGAPPAGAGSYGCPHGQWVRVLDGTG